MKFWLIVFLFTPDGEFAGKTERAYDSEQICILAASGTAVRYVNTGVSIASFCVSDDHYSGRVQDEGVPLDF